MTCLMAHAVSLRPHTTNAAAPLGRIAQELLAAGQLDLALDVSLLAYKHHM